MDATTLPTLLLGGDPDGSPDDTYAAWQAALALPSVRGLVLGRTFRTDAAKGTPLTWDLI